MGKWSKSLPEPMEKYTDRAANALYFICMSMMDDFRAHDRAADARRAAAEVRAWRKSLGVTTGRWRHLDTFDVRTHLRRAAWRVLDADRGGLPEADVCYFLRGAEEHLRISARLLEKEVEE